MGGLKNVPSSGAPSRSFRSGHRNNSFHNWHLSAYLRAVHAQPPAPPRQSTPPRPLSPPPPGSILTVIPWLVKELSGELFGLPVLDPHDSEATAPVVRPTTPLPSPPPSPPVQPPLHCNLHPYYPNTITTRFIIPNVVAQRISEGSRIRVRAPPTIFKPEVEVTDWLRNGRRRTPEKITRRKFWLSRNGAMSVAVSDPAAPSLTNTVTWSEPSRSTPAEDLAPIRMPTLSENLLAKLV